MGDSELLKEILLDLHRSMGSVTANLAEVKADLREHMKRTAMLESEIKWIHRQIWIAHGAIALLGILGTFVGVAIKYF
jgi:hypothetical protein